MSSNEPKFEDFPSIYDINDYRWWKLSPILSFLKIPTKKVFNTLQYIRPKHLSSFKNLKILNDQYKDEANFKYVTEEGIKQYCNGCVKNGYIQQSIAENLFAVLNFSKDEIPVTYTYKLTLESFLSDTNKDSNDDDNILQLYVIIKEETRDVWVEGVKACKILGYNNGQDDIDFFVSAENKRKLENFEDLSIPQEYEEKLENVIFLSKTGFMQITNYGHHMAFRTFWMKIQSSLTKRYGWYDEKTNTNSTDSFETLDKDDNWENKYEVEKQKHLITDLKLRILKEQVKHEKIKERLTTALFQIQMRDAEIIALDRRLMEVTEQMKSELDEKKLKIEKLERERREFKNRFIWIWEKIQD